MVAIVSGSGLGLGNTSLATLGLHGQVGSAAHGRNGQAVAVNVATGNLVLQSQDEYLVSRGTDAAVLRTYNSRGQLAGSAGWMAGARRPPLVANGTLNEAGSTVERTAADGAAATYLFDQARGAYVSTEGDGAYDTIVYTGSISGFTWTDGATGAREHYTKAGAEWRLLSATDASGHGLTYSHAANGLLASVTTDNGEKTQFVHAAGVLAEVRTEAGGVTTSRVRYTHDDQGRLLRVEVELSPRKNTSTAPEVYATDYVYDANGQLCRVSQTDGSRLDFGYLQVGQEFLLASVTDALGQVTSFRYDVGAPGQTTVTDALGQVTRYDTDAAGRLLRIVTPAVDGVARVRSFTYTTAGDVAAITDAAGDVTSFKYDANGNCIREKNAAGSVVERSYDGLNQLVEERVFVAGVAQVTRHVYASAIGHQLRFTVSAEGHVTEFIHDAFGQLKASLRYAGAPYTATLPADAAAAEAALVAWAGRQDLTRLERVDRAYDARGQLSARTTYARTDAEGNGVPAGGITQEEFVYDARGLLRRHMAGNGGWTDYTYDGLGRVLTETNALGAATTTRYLDAEGRTAVTTAGGLTTTRGYDKAGRMLFELQSSATDSNLGTTRYYHDASGALRMTQDPVGVRQWMLYDAAGRKLADIDGTGTLTEYGYTADDLLAVRTTYGQAVDTARLVDADGKPVFGVTLEDIRPSSSAGAMREWRVYDEAGGLAFEARAVGDGSQAAVTETRYDAASRITVVVRYAALVPVEALAGGAIARPQATSGHDRTVRHFHDADGRLEATLDGEGYLALHRFDAAGRHVETLAYATAVRADLRGSGTLAELTASLDAADAIRTITLYNGRGQAVARVDGERFLTETVYDGSGNATRTVRYATRVVGPVGAGSLLQAVRPASSPDDAVTAWVYDPLGRVLQQTGPDGVVTDHTYDSQGRLTSTQRAAGTPESRSVLARYDVQGRLVGELAGEGAALLTGDQTQQQVDDIWRDWGLRHFYDAAGRRTLTLDQFGQRTLFYYDADGARTHTVNALGEVRETRYNDRGEVAMQIDYADRISLDGLAGGVVTASLAATLASIASGSRDSRVVTTYTADGLLQTRSESAGPQASYRYNAFGDATGRSEHLDPSAPADHTASFDRRGLRVETVADAGGVHARASVEYDAYGRAVRTVDALGKVRTQTFDRLGRALVSTDPLGAARSVSYDAFDRVLTEVDALGGVTHYAYDRAARTMKITTPEGITTTTTRTVHGAVLSVTDANGAVTTYAYDRSGRLLDTATPLATTRNTYDRAGRLGDATDANGTIVRHAYDAVGRVLARTVDPSGLALVTTYTYDSRGRQLSVTDPNGVATVTAYDRSGRVLRRTVDPDGLALRTDYGYDDRGNVVSMRSPGGTSTDYEYDGLGRRTQERVDPGGLDLVRGWSYDDNGNVASTTDAAGNVTRHFHDAAGRLVYTVGPLGEVRENVYDKAGRVTRTAAYATPIATSALPAAATLEQVAGLLVPNAAQDAVEHRVLDADGRLLATVDGTRAIVTYAYDGNGRVLQRVAHANVGAVVPVLTAEGIAAAVAAIADPGRDSLVRNTYDAAGRLAWSVDGVGAVTRFIHDGNGNLLQRIAYATPVAPGASPATVAAATTDRKTSMVYDAAGRMVFEIDANRAVIENVFDAAGRVLRRIAYAVPIASVPTLGSAAALAAVRAELAPDAAHDRTTSHAYDAAGRPIATADATGAMTITEYDAAGNVVALIARAKPLTVALPATVTPAFLAAVPAPDPDDRRTTYTYDAAGRRLSETDALGNTESYGYDAVGNRTSFVNRKGSTWTYAYDAAGRMVEEKSPPVYVLNVRPDGKGSLEVPGKGDQVVITCLAYDGLGRLLRRTEAAGLPQERTTSWVYDAAGRQISAIQPEVKVYAADLDDLFANTGARAEVVKVPATRTFFDALGNAVAGRDAGGAISWKTYDAAGRVVHKVDALGHVTHHRRNAFGDVVATVRYAEAIVLPTSISAAPQAVTADEVAAALAAPGLSHAGDRTLVYTHDRAGRVVRIVEPTVLMHAYDLATGGSTKTAGRSTSHVYNAFGEVIETISTQGVGDRVSSHTRYYDKAGRETTSVDALGYLTRQVFDAFGNLVERTEYAKALAGTTWSSGTPPSVPTASAQDRTTRYAYDALNRKSRETRVGVTFGDYIGNSAVADLSTQYFWDAVGNQVCVIDAAGGRTYTRYDALGRVSAVIGPARAVDGKSATPLTTLWRDAHGNLTTRIDHADSATTFTGPAYPSSPSGDDRYQRYAYDRLGRLLQHQDALGNSEYFSHDAHGNVAKSWRSVTGADLAVRTSYEVRTYDKVGHLVRTVTPGSTSVAVPGAVTTVAATAAGVVTTEMKYNAFGEMTSRGTPGDPEEFWEYDDAGRAWRTNSGDGQVRIQLFDVQGNVTSEIRSSGAGSDDVDLRALPDAQAAAARPYSRRTDIVYDDLGRVQAQVDASRREVQGGVVVQRQSISVTELKSAQRVYLEQDAGGSYHWSSANSVTVGWNSLSSLGSGDIKVSIQYLTPRRSAPSDASGAYGPDVGGTPLTVTTQALDGAAAAAGYTMTWPETGSTADGGIAQVTRVIVHKKDVQGLWRVVVDYAPGHGAELIDVVAPPNPATGVALYLRPAGSIGDTGWFAVQLRDFGTMLRYDASDLLAGTYDYRVLVSPTGEPSHVSAEGKVNVLAAGGLSQVAGANGETRWLRPTVLQATDRWGNVVERTDPRSAAWKTTYAYNAANQLVRQVQPAVAAAPSGAVTSLVYDELGRQVAIRDARGYVNAQVWDAAGRLVQERSANGGVVRHDYSIFGDKVRTTDAESRVTSFGYDKLGRMTTMVRGKALVYSVSSNMNVTSTERLIDESWAYDELGRQRSHTNGNGHKTLHHYDLRGNLVLTTQPMGQQVRAAYDAQGRKTAEQDANGRMATWSYHRDGKLAAHTDLGGAVYRYTYDNARQLLAQTNDRGQNLAYSYDAAGQVIQIRDHATGKTTSYSYDLSGRRVRERVQHGATFYQDNQLSYDARGQLRDVADGRVHIGMQYDDSGNRTRITTRVNYKGAVTEQGHYSERHFRYDEMNRQVVVDGIDAAGNIDRTQGHILTYDRNGNRTSDRSWGNRVVTTSGDGIVRYDADGGAVYGPLPDTYARKEGLVTDTYTYDALNRLQSVERGKVQIDLRRYDGADRVMISGPLSQPEAYMAVLNEGLAPNESNGHEIRINRYDANGRLLQQRVKSSEGRLKSDTSWDKGQQLDSSRGDYITDGYDAAGNVLGYVVHDYSSGNVEYTNTLARFEGYQAATTTARSTTAGPGATTQKYDVNGHLVSFTDAEEDRNNRSFVNDAEGRVLLVKRAGGHVQRQLIANGEVLGTYGVGPNPLDPSEDFVSIADFNFSYSRISASYPNATPGAYRVQPGDTLQAIAQASYGDSSLWFRIADANGLSTSTDLKVGQTLTIPNRVSTISNNSTTFKPYDPSQIVGDTTPTLASPDGKGCGGVGQIVMLVVAVVVTIYTAGLAAGWLGAAGTASGTGVMAVGGAALSGGGTFVMGSTGYVLGSAGATAMASAAIGAAAGSVASQMVGVAIGATDRFSWKSVALSALGAGISAGVGGTMSAGSPAGGAGGASGARTVASFPGAVARAVVSNVATQGIAVATGLQKGFDWRGVAASAVGAGVGHAAGEVVGSAVDKTQWQPFAKDLVTRSAAGLAGGLAAAVMRGGRFVVQQVAVDAFGNALGQSLADAAKPQTGSIYSLSNNESGVGLHAGVGGTGLNYAGRRASVMTDDVFQGDQRSVTPDLNAGAVVALRESLGLPAVLPEEGWVLAAGPSHGRSFSGYGPASPTGKVPFARKGADGADRSSAVLGATAGVAASFGKMAIGAARVGSNFIMQSGDLLTGGLNHDHPVMQQVWAEQRAMGTGIVNLLANPVAAATDLIEGVVDRYDTAMAQPTDFDRSHHLGALFNDVGQGALGTGLLIRGTARVGATGLEYVGESAFTGPVTGGRAAQAGAINLRGLDAASRARILERFRSGNEFEAQARTAMDVSKNFERVYGSGDLSGKYAVPDSMRSGIVEFKDVRELSKDLQFQLYEQSRRRIELVVSPRTEYISGPLIEGVRTSAGAISIFNPRTGLFHHYDFDGGVFLIKGSK